MSKDKKKDEAAECTLNKPVLVYVSDRGHKVACPVHGEHIVYGARVQFG
jgi:hypothetical protein